MDTSETVAAVPAATKYEEFTARRPLTAQADRWLKHGLARVMPDLRMPELFAVRPHLFQETNNLVVAVDSTSGDPVAALGTRWACTRRGEQFLHISVQFIAERWRGRSVFAESWLRLLSGLVAEERFPSISALKTYNPVAYCAMREYGRLPGAYFFPEVNGEQDERMCRLAPEIAGALAPGHAFECRSGVISGIGAPANLYISRPTCGIPGVNTFFKKHTRPGDRVLCLVEIRDLAAQAAIISLFTRRTSEPSRRAAAGG